jgi:hypothetical protein
VNAQPGMMSPHAMFFDLGFSCDMFNPFHPGRQGCDVEPPGLPLRCRFG